MFHTTPAAAVRSGFRPCRRCRPDEEATSSEQAERIAAARVEADRVGVGLFVNARCDVFFGAAVDEFDAEQKRVKVEKLACPQCAGRGTLKSTETVTYEVFREITRAVRQFEAKKLLVLASPKVVNKILEEESVAVAELEEFIGKSIRFQADEQYAQEQYDVVLL